MIPEIKTKWIEALRSGKYNQGTGKLFTDGKTTESELDEHCCLGVLGCILHKPFNGDGTSFIVDMSSLARDYIYPALGETGLSNNDMRILYNMNDTQMCTFDEIASYIENNL